MLSRPIETARQTGKVRFRTHIDGFRNIRDLPQVPLQIARCGGAGVLRDDGRGWRERTADRRPRSDKGFETAHGEGANL